jgi:DNA-binding NarL/FixJ family response regulator
MTVRVHLADDHTMFRQGLEAILASREGIEVVGSSSTGPEADVRVAETEPDVVVTQLDMDLKTAEEILSGLREASPDSRIVVLTLWDNARYLKAIAAMGMDALMHKTSSAGELSWRSSRPPACARAAVATRSCPCPAPTCKRWPRAPAASPAGRSR